MPRLAVTAPYSSVFGRKPTLSEILRRLREFNLEETFRYLSKMNYVLSEDDPRALPEAIKYAFSKETEMRMRVYAMRKPGTVLPIHRQQVLIAMKLLALSHSDDGGKSPDDESARHELGDT